MLLYHFPLTSNSATPNLENKGLKSDYTLENGWTFEQEGKLSSYCARTNKKSLTIPISGDFTLCFRFKSKIIQSNYSRLFALENASSLLVNIYYTIPSTYIQIGKKSLIDIFEVNDNIYHDVVVTRKNGVANIFFDNVKLGTDSDNDATSICFCKKIPTSQRFDCYLQDIRIYDYCLSKQEIKDYSKALVLHYPLNGSELGNVVKDCSGLGNDGEIKESVATYVEGSPRGEFSYSIKPSYIRSKVIPLQEFSISFWMKQREQITAGGSVAHHIISCVESGGCCLRLYRSGDIQLGIYGDGSSITLNMSEKIVVGIWYHVCAIYTQNSIKLYLNGSASSEKTSIPIIYNSDTPWAIGVNPNASGYDSANPMPPVNISDVRVYATALSESDIKDLYNAPINFDKTSMNAIKLSENAKYKSFAWRTPTYDEMNYIINTRNNATNLRGLGRVNVNGSYVNGLFILPDDFVTPSGITFTPTNANFTTNSYTLDQFKDLESIGVVFAPAGGYRDGTSILYNTTKGYLSLSTVTWNGKYHRFTFQYGNIGESYNDLTWATSVRLVRSSSQGKFSTSATTKIDFAPANLQYHCIKHIWRFAEHQYDSIGNANSNISDTYDGWIDLFGYGTSGVNYSPTLHTTDKADYASGDISGTQNDWGVNEIVEPPCLDYDNKFYKTGVVKANEISEGTQCFNENGITYEKIKEI